MNTYRLEVQETLLRVIEVEAQNSGEAYSKVKQMYQKEEIVLSSSDFYEVEIRGEQSYNEEIEKDVLISEIINYLYNDEKKHYEELDNEKPLNHIYLKLKKLKGLI